MMVSYHSNISQLERQLADLQGDVAKEIKKEADLFEKQNRALAGAQSTKSASTMSSKLREAERAGQELARVASKRADLTKKIAAKRKDLTAYQEKQANADLAARKKAADEQKRMIREREDHERRLRSDLSFRALRTTANTTAEEDVAYDFFISHASEDKDSVVRDLANALKARGASVFYDEATLRVGDSLRRKIDEGLRSSKFGVVVLSESFFKKEWPARELDGLVALETQGQTRILPIWHKVSKDEVSHYSPTLADKVALNTSLKGVDEIADELFSLLPA